VTKTDFELKILSPKEYDIWDKFVVNSKYGSIFQTAKYIGIIADSFRRPAKILAVLQADKIVGGIVLLPRKMIYKYYVSSPFFMPYNWFIISEFDNANSYRRRVGLQHRVLDLLQQEIISNYVYAHLSVSPELEDFRCLVQNNWHFSPTFHIHMALNSKEGLDHLLRRNQRRNIEEAERYNYDFRLTQNIKDLFRLVELSYSHHKLYPPLNQSDFHKFCSNLLEAETAKIYELNKENQVVSSLFVVENKPTVYAFFAGRDLKREHANAELYLYWKLMQYYRDKGYKVFDFLGGMVPSIAYVKLGLGGHFFRFDQISYYRNSFIQYFIKTEIQRRGRKRMR
jgi:hypothetical protein